MRALILTLFTSLFLTATAHAALPEIGQAAPNFSAKDAFGKPVSLGDFKGKIVVLEWNNPGCPFVKKHYDSKNMQRLQEVAADRQIVWLTINSSAEGKQGYMDADTLKKFVTETQHKATHYIADADGAIGRAYGAKTTPHMFVIDANGVVAYMGAIDDNHSPKKETVKGAKNYVFHAFDNLQAGKPVEVSSTVPYGCSVKYAH